MQLRARTRCPLRADNSHTSELRSVFSDVHAAGENDLIDFSLASEKLCEAFLTNCDGLPPKREAVLLYDMDDRVGAGGHDRRRDAHAHKDGRRGLLDAHV